MRLVFIILMMLSIFIDAQDTTRVLFIGNSITYYNNMPQTFEAIANSKGDQTLVTMYAPGGTGFVNHVADPNVYTKFRQGNWDFVVLQPGSSESIGASFTKEVTLGRAKTLKDSILKHNPCAKILYYEISYGIWGTTQSNINTYDSTQTEIKAYVSYWADSTQLFYSPAGECIKTAWHQNVNDILWVGTGNIHPNAKGSYIIALSFYASIFQNTTFGTTVTGPFTQAVAQGYQTMVDTIVLNHLSDWRINTYQPTNDFNYTMNNGEIILTNLSQNIDSVMWNFGDGFTSTNFNTTHTYATLNTFDVTLSVFKNGCQIDSTQQIVIAQLGLNELIDKIKFEIYPNPANQYLTVKSNFNNVIVEVYNSYGAKVLESNKGYFDISTLKNGFYFIRLIHKNEKSALEKLIIQH